MQTGLDPHWSAEGEEEVEFTEGRNCIDDVVLEGQKDLLAVLKDGVLPATFEGGVKEGDAECFRSWDWLCGRTD